LVASSQPQEAVRVLDELLVAWRGDARLWQHLARAHEALGQRARAHYASGEAYALLGSPLTAVEQLRLAQRAGDADFYTGSVIDARLRELQADALRELEETRQRAQQR
jgi:predicted Zn-dependent protease